MGYRMNIFSSAAATTFDRGAKVLGVPVGMVGALSFAILAAPLEGIEDDYEIPICPDAIQGGIMLGSTLGFPAGIVGGITSFFLFALPLAFGNYMTRHQACKTANEMCLFKEKVAKLDLLLDDELTILFTNIVSHYSSRSSMNRSESSKALIAEFTGPSTLLQKRDALKVYLTSELGGAFCNDGKALFLIAKKEIDTAMKFADESLIVRAREPRIITENEYCGLEQKSYKSNHFFCFFYNLVYSKNKVAPQSQKGLVCIVKGVIQAVFERLMGTPAAEVPPPYTATDERTSLLGH